MYNIIFFITLLALGYGFGRWAESKHYKDILQREEELNSLPAIASRFPPVGKVYNQELVMGSVVISIDYFKHFLASLRNLFGGRVASYETLLDRARREALLRMKEEARKRNAKMVFNVKYETSSISKGVKNTVGSVEMLAYGTALIPQKTA
ncbi:MAG: YbjQ family protein [Gammaproteobacteria bacterium]